MIAQRSPGRGHEVSVGLDVTVMLEKTDAWMSVRAGSLRKNKPTRIGQIVEQSDTYYECRHKDNELAVIIYAH